MKVGNEKQTELLMQQREPLIEIQRGLISRRLSYLISDEDIWQKRLSNRSVDIQNRESAFPHRGSSLAEPVR